MIRELSLEDLPALEKLYQKEGVTWRLDADGERIPGFIEPLFAKEKKKISAGIYYQYVRILWIWDVAGFDKASGELIGRAGLEHREFPDAVELELGYLIDPDRQGQGLATEVCQAILAFAREELDFQESMP